MKIYIAKTDHKRPCDLCGSAIIPGDAVETWAWVNPNEPPPMGNIMRVHLPCMAIANEIGVPDEWTPGEVFDDIDGAHKRADAAIAKMRLTGGNSGD